MNYMQKNYQINIQHGLMAKFFYTTGKRYVKIIKQLPSDRYGVVHSFIDIQTGNIYKPASHSAPAKGIRGNIFNNGGLSALDEAANIKYLR